MNTVPEILEELRSMGKESAKKVLMKGHGVKEPCFGVLIGDMKRIQKRVKKDHELALGLYATGNYDAMYLAGLIADDARMTQQDLQRWVEQAYGGGLPGTTVASVAAGGPHAREMGLRWIESPQPNIVVAGWATLCGLVATRKDAELGLDELRHLLKRVEQTIHHAPDAVRYGMNSFVISLGGYVAALTEEAIQTGERIGKVEADLGDNACQMPYAPDYIRKMQSRGSIGKKRKTMKC